MKGLEDKERLFLDFYIANGLRASTKVECYRMAFPDKKLTDSSAETYAKRILASEESKAYIAERKLTSSTQSHQLMQTIRHLDEMLKRQNLKIYDEISILKEKRLTINELSKLIQVIKPDKSIEDEFVLSDFILDTQIPFNLNSIRPENALDLIRLARDGSFLSVSKDGKVNLMTPTSSQDGEIIIKAVENGKYRVAAKKSDLN